jgi:hypothetical protein
VVVEVIEVIMSSIKSEPHVCYVYPVSKTHRLCKKGITYHHIKPYIEQLSQNYQSIRPSLMETIPFVLHSLQSGKCYRDENGNCVSPMIAFDWDSIPLKHVQSLPLLPNELYTSDKLREYAKEASSYPDVQQILGTASYTHKSNITSDVMPILLYLLVILSMPHLHKKNLRNRIAMQRGGESTQSLFQFGGDAEIIEQEKLPVSKKHQAIFAMTIMDENKQIHSVIAKMTSKQFLPYFRAYKDEQRIYEYLYKKHHNRDHSFIPYYGTHTGTMDESFAIKKTITMYEFGRVRMDIPLHSGIINIYAGDEYTVMFMKNMSETHISIHDYVKGLMRAGITKDFAYKKVMDTYRNICKTMMHVNNTYHLIHGDFHTENCFVSTKDGSIVVFDFDFSCILGQITNKSIFLYGIYNSSKELINKYNTLSPKIKDLVRNRYLIVDLIRMYNFISYKSEHYYYFETYYKNPAYRVVFDNNGYWTNIGKSVYLTSKYFEENLTAEEYNEWFSDFNGFLMSAEYYDVIFEYMDNCHNEYAIQHQKKQKCERKSVKGRKGQCDKKK